MKTQNLTKQTLVGFVWLALGKGSKAILQLVILGVLARLLGPKEFGLITLALIVTSFSDIFTDLGFGPAITQKRELKDVDISTSFTFSILFGVLLLLGVIVLAPSIAVFFNTPELVVILRAISPVLFLSALSSTARALLLRNMKYKESSILQVISYSIGYGAMGITLAYMGYGVWSLVFAILGQSLLSTILYFYYSKQRIRIEFNKTSFRELLHFGGGYSLSKIFTYFGAKGEKIVVGRVLGVELLGLYERGYTIVKFVAGLVGEIIDQVLFAPMAKKQEDRALIGRVFLELTYLCCAILMPFSFFVYSNAESIVVILLGPKWGETVEIVQIMALSLFFLVCTRIGSTLAKSLGDVYNRAIRTLLYSIFVICGAYFAARWGIKGVATAVTGAIAINYMMAFTQTKKLTNVSIMKFAESHFFGIGLSVAYMVLYYFMSISLFDFIESHIIKLLLSSVIMALVYGLSYFIDYKGVIKRYIKIIFKK